MVDPVWNGGDGSWKDKANWSPAVVPTAGSAVVTAGTVIVNNLDLTGVVLQTFSNSPSSPATIDVHNSTLGPFVISEDQHSFPIADMNVKGEVTSASVLDLGGGFKGENFGSTLNLNIVNQNSEFVNTGTIFEQTFSHFNETGKGTFVNDGSMVVEGANATFGTDVVGTGVIHEQIGIDTHNSVVEFIHGVAAGQTVNLDGTTLILDDAKQFQGLINFAEPPSPFGGEVVELKGIVATSSSYSGGIFDVFSGNQLAASLRLTANDPHVTTSGGNSFITTT
jgi:hypothetical protein